MDLEIVASAEYVAVEIPADILSTEDIFAETERDNGLFSPGFRRPIFQTNISSSITYSASSA